MEGDDVLKSTPDTPLISQKQHEWQLDEDDERERRKKNPSPLNNDS